MRLEVEGDSQDLAELYRELCADEEIDVRAVPGEGTDGAGEPILVLIAIEVGIAVATKIAERVGNWFRRRRRENRTPVLVVVTDGRRVEVSGDQLVVVLTGGRG
jgi:hypothetical protein